MKKDERPAYLERLISLLGRCQRLYTAVDSPDFAVLSLAMQEARAEKERLIRRREKTSPPGPEHRDSPS